jgi:hypothetical protein
MQKLVTVLLACLLCSCQPQVSNCVLLSERRWQASGDMEQVHLALARLSLWLDGVPRPARLLLAPQQLRAEFSRSVGCADVTVSVDAAGASCCLSICAITALEDLAAALYAATARASPPTAPSPMGAQHALHTADSTRQPDDLGCGLFGLLPQIAAPPGEP